jgi:hypothetical protein
MASPFHVFRKHQRAMLVVVGLLCIISFVFLGQMDSLGGRPPGEIKNPLVVSSDYGDLYQFDVERLRMLQSILYSFLNQADQESWQASGGDPSRFRPTRPPQVDERYAIHTFLLAGKADEMGIVVDDEVILNRLKKLGLSENRLREMLQDYRFEGEVMTTRHLFDAYRTDLKASRVRQSYGLAVPDRPRTGPPTIYTPAESFESYCKLNEMVQIESVAVPAQQFIDQVKDPSPSVLQAFFDKYKDKVDLPMMVGGVQMPAPEPGFKQPPRTQIQYLEANYLAYLDLAKQQVTDEEVAKYYEDNKRQFEKLNLLDAPGEKAPGDLDLTLPELDKQPGEDPATTPESSPESATKEEGTKEPESKEPEPKEPAPGEKPATPEEKPAAPEEKATPAEPAAAEEKPADAEKPAEGEKPADPAKPAPEGEKPAEGEPQSLILDGTQTEFVSLQADAEGAPAADAPAKETPAADAPAKDAPAEEKAPEEKPAAEKTAEETPAAEKPAPADATLPESATTDKPEADLPEFKTPATDAPAEEATGEKKPGGERTTEYKPLAEVADDIRQTLAEQRAGLNMLSQIEPLQLELQNYWKPKLVRKLKAHDEATTLLPEGFLDRAEKANMVFQETDPEYTSYFQLIDIPLGQAGVPMGEGVSQSKIPLAQYAFIGQMDLYQVVLAEGDDGNKYLAWKIGETEEKVPELDEVRDEVITAWKLIEARKLAEAEAKRIAEIAKKAGVPLDKALGEEGLSVLFSQPFTWMTRGNVSQFDFNAESRLSEISGITGADNDFMKKIFGMKEGEIEVIENYPKSAFYVVRLAQKVIPTATLQANYLRDEQTHPFLRPWDQEARRKVLNEVYEALLAEVELDGHVTWHDEEGKVVESDELESDAGN